MDKIIASLVLSIFFVFDGACSKIQQYPEQRTAISKEAREVLVQRFTTLGCDQSKVEEILASMLVEENPLSDGVLAIPMNTQVQTLVSPGEEKHSFIGSAVQLLLKEPIRLVQFFIKTARLKRESHEIPVGFMIATITRFIGATAIDLCIGANIINDFFEESFLNGIGGWISGGIFIAAECLNLGGRTLVRSMYSGVSSLYGENGVNHSNTARSEL